TKRLARRGRSWLCGGFEAANAVRPHAAHAGAAFAVETAKELLVLIHQPAGVLGVRLRNDVTVFVLRDREQPVEVMQVSAGRLDGLRQLVVRSEPKLLCTHYCPDDGELAQHRADTVDPA